MQNFTGTVDLGGGPSSSEDKFATHALVYMVNCVNGNWKMPIGHFFTAGLSGIELANLTKVAIVKLNETGIIVTSVVCDNPSNNWAMMEHLGAKLYRNEPKVTLDLRNNMGIPVFVVFDVCHLIKLVRNCLGDLKILQDDKGDKIAWTYIEELEKLQRLEGLHIANKLCASHLDYNSNKMKTSLAVQTLSKSVSKSLVYCRDRFEQFRDSRATSRFLELFNNIFDWLNSRSKFGKEKSAPLQETNCEQWSSDFRNMKKYILSLKDKRGVPLVTGPRKCAFLGLVVTMQSFLFMYQCYVSTRQLDYLLTFKFSQDHLGNKQYFAYWMHL